ncbi:MAG: hypothetical protein N3A02_05530, partial [Rectinema sp.]|nr:hypothetical protein [Rectinema sp.]
VYLSKTTARNTARESPDSSPKHHVDVSLGQNTEMFQEMARRLWENRQHLEKITYGGKGDQQRTLDFSLSAQTETGFVKTIVGILQNGDSINVSLKMHPIDAVSNLVVQPALLMKDKNSNANDILVNGSKVVERHSSLVKSMEDIAQKAESDKTQTPEKLQNALNSAPFKAIFDDMRKQKHKLLHHDSIKAFLVAGESSWGFTKQEPAGQEDDSQSHKPYEQSGTVKIARRHIDTYNILNPEEFFKDRKNAVWLNFCAAFGTKNRTQIEICSEGFDDGDLRQEKDKERKGINMTFAPSATSN